MGHKWHKFLLVRAIQLMVFATNTALLPALVEIREHQPPVGGWGSGGAEDIIAKLEEHRLARVPRTVNGTGHTGPSEFCATSI